MKILILGAGAVGGYWGARLHQAGVDVTFLLREKRAEAVKRDGLVVKSPRGDATLPVKVVTKASDGGPYDVVILACKAYDLPSAMDAVAPAVGANTTIVPILNGHAHFATLDAKFGADKVAGGLARISGMLGPNGEILHSGANGVSFGERGAKPARASLVELDAACKKAGIEGGLNPNIDQDLWDKWIMLGSIASMCSAMRGSIGDIMASEDGEAIMNEILEECRQVAAAAGHAPSEKALAAVRGSLTQKGGKAVASILGDMEKGGAVEGKQIVGDMLARARKAGIAAPNLRFAYAHLQTYEARRASRSPEVKALILGAGAIGGYVGGRLQQSGADVTFLVRPARSEALQRDGLVIKSTKGDITQKVKTVLSGSEGGPYDVVLLTCKAYDLDSAIAAIAPAVGPNTTVVPLLNGMRHLDVLDAKFGKDKVVGGLARVGVAMSAEGTILHTSPFAAISFGERDGKPPRASLVALDAAIKKSGIDGGLNPNIVQDLWDKWIMLCSLAATCCLMRGSSGDILEADEGQAIVLETVEEGHKVAAAAGHDPGDEGMQTIRSFLTVKGSRFTASMLHDLEKGAMVEADHVVGDMIARAKKAGIATPNLRMAYAHLQVYMARRSRRS